MTSISKDILLKTSQVVIGPRGEIYTITLEEIDSLETYNLERVGLIPDKFILQIGGKYKGKTLVFMNKDTGPVFRFKYVARVKAVDAYERLGLVLKESGVMEICGII